MNTADLLKTHLINDCPTVHARRLQSVMEVASALQRSQDLSMAAMGRKLDSPSKMKNKIKKVDRLEINPHLHDELAILYSSLSKYIFTYISHEAPTPIIIDVCCLRDNCAIQMLSAEMALKGRSLPLYRDVFKQGELKKERRSLSTT